jgi:hypothetical protein
MRNRLYGAAIALVVLVGAIVLFKGYSRLLHPQEPLSALPEQSVSFRNHEVSGAACPDGWERYRHEALGLQFCYPKEWGEPKIVEIPAVTRLGNMREEFKRQNVYYDKRLSLAFKENYKVSLSLFDDQYGGLFHPNDSSYVGYIDNFSDLKASGDICDYKVDFNYPWNRNTVYDAWSECRDGVRVALVEERVHSSDRPYSYMLQGRAYKKLQNGSFDHLFVEDTFYHESGLAASFKAPDDLLEGKRTTDPALLASVDAKERFGREKKEFETFVATIAAFEPSPKSEEAFQDVPGENPDITAIRKYYWFLSAGKMNEAYDMYADKAVPFEKYQGWYRDVRSAKPRDFEDKGSHTYRFFVDYQDENHPVSVYRVSMQVSDAGGIRTLSSEEITSQIITAGNFSAFVKRSGDKTYVVLAKDGKESVVDQGDAEYAEDYWNMAEVKHFDRLEFSPTGRYLFYAMYGWEWAQSYVYDTWTGKRAVVLAGGKHGFADGDRYVYSCASPGMIGGEGKVFSLPGGKTEYDIYSDEDSKNYSSIDCSAEDDQRSVTFSLSLEMEASSDGRVSEDRKAIRFDLDAKKVL